MSSFFRFLTGLVALFLLVTLFGSYTIVGSGQRGVVTHFSRVTGSVLGEGFHFKLPIVTSVHKINVRVQRSNIQTEASSKDLQEVQTVFTINWHPEPEAVNLFFQQVGSADLLVDNIMSPAVAEVLKSVTAKRTAEEIIARRLELKEEIDALLKARLIRYHVLVDDVSLVDLKFSAGFNHAIEEKQIAEQDALKARYTALKAQQDAQAVVNRADGEAQASLKLAHAQAEAQRLMQRTITPEILQLEYYKKWDGSVPQVIVGGANGQPFMFNLPLNRFTRPTTGDNKAQP